MKLMLISAPKCCELAVTKPVGPAIEPDVPANIHHRVHEIAPN